MSDELAEEKEVEYAEMNSVRVLETNILHASDVIYFLDGSTAELTTDMGRVTYPLDIRFSQLPRDAKVINSAGKSALLRKPTNTILNGVASNADKARPVFPTYSAEGEVWDLHRKYNPAKFDFTLGLGNGESVVLYPTPMGTQNVPGGAVYGSLKLNGDSSPLIWALIELEITLSESESQTYKAQTDASGDFAIALTRLPPLPESITQYNAVLSVTVNSANTADAAPDTTTYTATELQSSSTNAFNATFSLTVKPGERTRVNSNEKEFLAATTS